MHANWRRRTAVCLAALAALLLTACGGENISENLVAPEEEPVQVVNLFSPMEKTAPDAENVARTASDLTVMMAEETLGVSMVYRTYTAEGYQDKTYDEVVLDRARNNMDDLYLWQKQKQTAKGMKKECIPITSCLPMW